MLALTTRYVFFYASAATFSFERFLPLPPSSSLPSTCSEPSPPPFTHLFNDFSDALEGRAVLLVFVVAQRHVVLQVGLVAQISERVAVLGAGRVVGCCFLDWVRLYWGGSGCAPKKE